ncbi:MAG: DJ-1/PfpI family protein [Synoicihabitans sp.]
MSGPTARLKIAGVFFPGFELLDIFGPLELFGLLTEKAEITTVGTTAGPLPSAQGPKVHADLAIADLDAADVVLVPGGVGARQLVNDTAFLDNIVRLHRGARYTASICTGAALLARAGLLDGKRATTNKLAFDFPVSQAPEVDWQRRARWVEDGRIFTASGVSAGMDMSLALIARIWDRSTADFAAHEAEYIWSDDPHNDPFATA